MKSFVSFVHLPIRFPVPYFKYYTTVIKTTRPAQILLASSCMYFKSPNLSGSSFAGSGKAKDTHTKTRLGGNTTQAHKPFFNPSCIAGVILNDLWILQKVIINADNAIALQWLWRE